MFGNILIHSACGHLPQPQPLRQLQLGRLGRSRRAFCSSLAPAPPPGCATRAQGLAPSHNASEEPGGAGGSRARGGRSGPEGAGWGPKGAARARWGPDGGGMGPEQKGGKGAEGSRRGPEGARGSRRERRRREPEGWELDGQCKSRRASTSATQGAPPPSAKPQHEAPVSTSTSGHKTTRRHPKLEPRDHKLQPQDRL